MNEVDHIQQLKEEIKIMISMERGKWFRETVVPAKCLQTEQNNGADFLKEMLEGLSNDTLDFIDT